MQKSLFIICYFLSLELSFHVWQFSVVLEEDRMIVYFPHDCCLIYYFVATPRQVKEKVRYSGRIGSLEYKLSLCLLSLQSGAWLRQMPVGGVERISGHIYVGIARL